MFIIKEHNGYYIPLNVISPFRVSPLTHRFLDFCKIDTNLVSINETWDEMHGSEGWWIWDKSNLIISKPIEDREDFFMTKYLKKCSEEINLYETYLSYSVVNNTHFVRTESVLFTPGKFKLINNNWYYFNKN